jgi:hypothetical protein
MGACLGALAIAISLLAMGCGGSDPTTVADTTGTKQAEGTPSAASSGPTKAVLHPVKGSRASGTIYYKKQNGIPLIEVDLQGLKPISGEQQYVIWQLGSRHDMLPVASYYAGKNGRIEEKIERAFEPFSFLENGTKTEVMVAYVPKDDTWRNGLSGGPKGAWDPLIVGRPLLEGKIVGSFVGEGE